MSLKQTHFSGICIAQRYYPSLSRDGLRFDAQGNEQDFGLIDNLSYIYKNQSNQLMRVNDTSHNEGFDNGANTGNDYAYDANGNLKKDLNKGILNIEYNHLNMPVKISFTGGNKIEYVYSAAGTKLKKTVTRSGNVNTTAYAGNFIYEDGALELFFQPEGYVQPDGNGGFEYVFQYKDHLGNIRLSYRDIGTPGNPNLQILDENNYYPFGLQHKGYNNVVIGAENNYKTYQGQELTEELGLNIHEWKYRISDPAIGRFWQVDPLAEDYAYQSPYNFAENKVISHLELEGLEGIHFTKVDAAGNTVHIIKKNVIVLTQAPRPIPAGTTPKKVARIKRRNARTKRANTAKVNKVKAELNHYYSGAENSTGEKVVFEFNVTAMETDNTDGGTIRDIIAIGLANGEESGEVPFDGAPNSIAPAAVITTDGSGSALGLTEGNVKISTNSNDAGTIAHEVAHTLMTGVKKEDDYPGGRGGLMDSPPGHINSKEVDRIIENSYEKK